MKFIDFERKISRGVFRTINIMADQSTISEPPLLNFTSLSAAPEEESKEAHVSVFVALESISVIVGILANLYLIYVAKRNSTFSFCFKHRHVWNDLRLFVLVLSIFNILYFLYILGEVLVSELGWLSPNITVCIVKVLHDAFAEAGLFCVLFFISKTCYMGSGTKIPTIKRFQTRIELALFAVLFLIVVFYLLGIKELVIFIVGGCYSASMLRIAKDSYQFVIQIFVLITSAMSIARVRREEAASPNIIKLGCFIGFMYVACWMPLTIYHLVDHIFSFYMSRTARLVITYITYLLSSISSVVYPFICLRPIFKFFDKFPKQTSDHDDETTNLAQMHDS